MAESEDLVAAEDEQVDITDVDVVLYEVARWKLDRQFGQIDSLDRKLAATLTLNGALIALVSAALAFRAEAVSTEVWGLSVAVLGVFMLNLLCTFQAYRSRQWMIKPELGTLEQVAANAGVVVTRIWLARQFDEAYQSNRYAIVRKVQWVRWAMALAMVDLVIAAIAAIVASWPW